MSENTITLEEAFDCATKFFRGIQYQTTFAGNSQLTLEEFEFVKSLKCWFITLGFVPVQREDENEYTTPRREYRIFQIDSVTGEVNSMKKGFMGHQEESAINVSSQPQVQEFGTLTICALRYCFGRASYMPSLVVDATRANWELLSKSEKATILKDVEQTIQNGRVGMDCDKQMWLRFYDWMLEKSHEKVD